MKGNGKNEKCWMFLERKSESNIPKKKRKGLRNDPQLHTPVPSAKLLPCNSSKQRFLEFNAFNQSKGRPFPNKGSRYKCLNIGYTLFLCLQYIIYIVYRRLYYSMYSTDTKYMVC